MYLCMCIYVYIYVCIYILYIYSFLLYYYFFFFLNNLNIRQSETKIAKTKLLTHNEGWVEFPLCGSSFFAKWHLTEKQNVYELMLLAKLKLHLIKSPLLVKYKSYLIRDSFQKFSLIQKYGESLETKCCIPFTTATSGTQNIRSVRSPRQYALVWLTKSIIFSLTLETIINEGLLKQVTILYIKRKR